MDEFEKLQLKEPGDRIPYTQMSRPGKNQSMLIESEKWFGSGCGEVGWGRLTGKGHIENL